MRLPWANIGRIMLAASIVGIIATDVWLLVERDTTTAVSLEDTVADFQAAGPEPLAGVDGLPPGATTTTTTTAGAAGPTATEPQAPATTTAPEVTAPAASSTTTTGPPEQARPFALPPQGVYSYRTDGYEEISTANARHDYPDETHAIVRMLGGCAWEFEHRFAEEHIETREWCSDPGRLFTTREDLAITFLGSTDRSSCQGDPLTMWVQEGDQPGTTRSFTTHCDDGTSSTDTATYEALESLTIDGQTVQAHRVRIDSDLSGRASGTAMVRYWLHADHGLLLRLERHVDSSGTGAFGAGRITYTEQVTAELMSLVPAT